MSVANSLKKAAYALPLVFMMAANANAAPPSTTIELDQIDLSKPIDGCFVTNNKGKAFDKLLTAMNARSQIVVATANQALKSKDNPLQAELFSSDINGGEGYDIMLEVPKDRMKETPVACAIPITNIKIYDVNKLAVVPAEVNKGELGMALRNGQKTGLKVMMTAQSYSGTLRALQFNADKGYGAYTSADINGNKAGDLGYLTSMKYSSKAEELLGMNPTGKKDTVAMAPAP